MGGIMCILIAVIWIRLVWRHIFRPFWKIAEASVLITSHNIFRSRMLVIIFAGELRWITKDVCRSTFCMLVEHRVVWYFTMPIVWRLEVLWREWFMDTVSQEIWTNILSPM